MLPHSRGFRRRRDQDRGAGQSRSKLEPLTDWPYIYIDAAADAAVAACFSNSRKQLIHYVAHPEKVTPNDLTAAAGAAGPPVRIEIDKSRPIASRGPLDTGSAARDF
jgi:nucleoside-diphosphate-sugar epimerase